MLFRSKHGIIKCNTLRKNKESILIFAYLNRTYGRVIKIKKDSREVPVLFGHADILAYLFVILAVIVMIIASNTRTAPQKVIVMCGETETEYPLSEDRTLKIENCGTELTVIIKDGAVYVESSTCRDGVCKNTGRITKTGQIIICAPATVAIRIEGDKKEGYDAVIR